MKADVWFASCKYLNPVMKKSTMSVIIIVFAKEKGVLLENKAIKSLPSNSIITVVWSRLTVLSCFSCPSGVTSWSCWDQFGISHFLPNSPIQLFPHFDHSTSQNFCWHFTLLLLFFNMFCHVLFVFPTKGFHILWRYARREKEQKEENNIKNTTLSLLTKEDD